MLNRNDSDTRDETKEENSEALVEVIPKSASKFDIALAPLIAISLALLPTHKSRQSILMYIPTGIWLGHILPFLDLEFDLKACLALSYRVARPLGYFFQSHLRDVRLKQLLQHIVYGNLVEAEKIIKSNPKLLLLRETVEDYSFGMDAENHRKIEGTAYQIALGAEDVRFHEKEVGMAEMIHGYLMKLLEGRAEIEKQQAQQFPAEYAEQEKEKAQKDLAALNKIIAVIEGASQEDCRSASAVDKTIQDILGGIALDTPVIYNRVNLKKIIKALSKADAENDFEAAFTELKNYLYQNAIIENPTFNFDILKAIYQFRNYLEPRDVIRTGKHFNVGLLAKAFKLYDEKYNCFGEPFVNYWESDKNQLFWQKVIGYIQRFLPACYAQAFAQGVYSIVENGQKLNRSLEFCYHKNTFFFPLDSAPLFRLGIDSGGVALGPGDVLAALADLACAGRTFQTYVEQKHHRCYMLCNSQTITQRAGSIM
jgi:hypothetical protein